MLKVVACALSPPPEKARTASSFTFGATPISLLCAAMAPAMAVPCECAGPGVPMASYSSAITPARSAWLLSILESITATSTSSPLLMRCASVRCSLETTYCAAAASDGVAACALLQLVEIIRLRDGDARIAHRCAQRRRHREVAGDAPALQRAAGQREALRLLRRDLQLACDPRERSLRDAGLELQQHLVAHEVDLARRRNADVAAARGRGRRGAGGGSAASGAATAVSGTAIVRDQPTGGPSMQPNVELVDFVRRQFAAEDDGPRSSATPRRKPIEPMAYKPSGVIGGARSPPVAERGHAKVRSAPAPA